MYKVNFYYLGNESEWENVKKGYGIFITTMLEEGDRLIS